jgi:hypothetical protein
VRVVIERAEVQPPDIAKVAEVYEGIAHGAVERGSLTSRVEDNGPAQLGDKSGLVGPHALALVRCVGHAARSSSHGDADEVVNIMNTEGWVDVMKELKMDYEFVKQPGISHGPVIQSGQKPIYEFFAKHKK